MKVQYSIAGLLRCVTFLAIALWAVTWIWAYPHMIGIAYYLVPATIGGAVGAILGKTPHGVFVGLAFAAFLPLALLVLIVVLTVVSQLL
jgi:hypothetical protein